MTLFEGLAKRPRRVTAAREKATIIGDVAAALARKGWPGMDVGAKNIVAAQIGHLIRGGYDAAVIRDAALTLALVGDPDSKQPFLPENLYRFAHLSRLVRQYYAKADYEQHEQVKAESSRPIEDPRVAELVAGVARARTMRRTRPARAERHDFVPRTDDDRVCAVCERGRRHRDFRSFHLPEKARTSS